MKKWYIKLHVTGSFHSLVSSNSTELTMTRCKLISSQYSCCTREKSEQILRFFNTVINTNTSRLKDGQIALLKDADCPILEILVHHLLWSQPVGSHSSKIFTI